VDLDTTRPVDGLRRITRATDAREVAEAAYRRLFDLLERLAPAEWQTPTECTGWDVAAMVGHLIGAAQACASPRAMTRQQWWGRRHADAFGGNSLDAANERQVRDHAALTPEERLAALRRVAPAAIRGRMRLPRPLRGIRLPLDPGGSTAPGMPARLSLGQLMDVIYTRDVWLHTIDIARATGRPYEPDPAVDGRVVEDVVAEWAGRHGEPVVLALSGPAGGRFRQGEGGGTLELDAITCGRLLSGRATIGADLAAIGIAATPPATARLLETRVVF
jgi:uncharacterized protein (TIGR03083 family)